MIEISSFKISKWSIKNLNELGIIDKKQIKELDVILDKKFKSEDKFLSDLAYILSDDTVYGNREQFIKFSNPEKYYSEEDDDNELPPPDIVSFTELRSCADLIRLYGNGKGKLIIRPDFQREVVWDRASQTRFIDSLTKQLPIPSLCFSLDYNTQKRLVIDGLQRIQSVINFLTNDNWRLSKLDDIDVKLSGKKVSEIRIENPALIEIVLNVALPITVLRCDYTKESHNSYLFTIFHRLNSGGNKLSNQEIRNCIYIGPFNDLLKSNCQYSNWRKLNNLKKGKSYRFKYEEYILRFYAFNENYKNYTGSLAKFLNMYMLQNRSIKEQEIENKRELFKRTIDLVFDRIADKKSIKYSNTVIEAVLIGVARNIEKLESNKKNLESKFQKLLKSKEFSDENLRGGLANKDKVNERLDKAIEIFS